MENSPLYIALAFGLITILSVYLFYKAAGRARIVLMIIVPWLIVQTIVSGAGFYTITDTMPPRFILAVGPPLLLTAVLFASKAGRSFIDSLSLRTLTILHMIRIPVEIVLLLLFLDKTVPRIMTFDGRNLDILSGISAPVVYYFFFIKKSIGRTGLLIWNFICLGLLINIVVIAILSAPFAFQRLAFDQPNIAVLYFPFIWLPACVVPLVLFSHLVSIRRLLSSRKTEIRNAKINTETLGIFTPSK
jgi:hypothetical protein